MGKWSYDFSGVYVNVSLKTVFKNVLFLIFEHLLVIKSIQKEFLDLIQVFI